MRCDDRLNGFWMCINAGANTGFKLVHTGTRTLPGENIFKTLTLLCKHSDLHSSLFLSLTWCLFCNIWLCCFTVKLQPVFAFPAGLNSPRFGTATRKQCLSWYCPRSILSSLVFYLLFHLIFYDSSIPSASQCLESIMSQQYYGFSLAPFLLSSILCVSKL